MLAWPGSASEQMAESSAATLMVIQQVTLTHAPDCCSGGGCPRPCLHLHHRQWWWLEEVENVEVGTEPGQGALVGGSDGSDNLDQLCDAEVEGHERWECAEERWP